MENERNIAKMNQVKGISLAITAMHNTLKQAIQRCKIRGNTNYDNISKAERDILNATILIQDMIDNEIYDIIK